MECFKPVYHSFLTFINRGVNKKEKKKLLVCKKINKRGFVFANSVFFWLFSQLNSIILQWRMHKTFAFDSILS